MNGIAHYHIIYICRLSKLSCPVSQIAKAKRPKILLKRARDWDGAGILMRLIPATYADINEPHLKRQQQGERK
jgi:hypothetical protein